MDSSRLFYPVYLNLALIPSIFVKDILVDLVFRRNRGIRIRECLETVETVDSVLSILSVLGAIRYSIWKAEGEDWRIYLVQAGEFFLLSTLLMGVRKFWWEREDSVPIHKRLRT